MQLPVETRTTIVLIDEEGILRARIKEDCYVKEKDVKELFDIYKKWGCDKNKVLQIMEGATFFSFDNAAQKYAATHGKDIFIASALVNKSLAVRILFNFFTRFYNAGMPFKLFSSETEALNWLRKFKE